MGDAIPLSARPSDRAARLARLRDRLAEQDIDLQKVVEDLRKRRDAPRPTGDWTRTVLPPTPRDQDASRLADLIVAPRPIVTVLPARPTPLRTWLRRWAARLGR